MPEMPLAAQVLARHVLRHEAEGHEGDQGAAEEGEDVGRCPSLVGIVALHERQHQAEDAHRAGEQAKQVHSA
jgi:hypothetical protein